MKHIEDLTDEEVLALTDEDLERLVKLRMAEEGIPLLPAPGNPPTNTVWRTASGRLVVLHWSRWQGEGSHAEDWGDATDAAATWLLVTRWDSDAARQRFGDQLTDAAIADARRWGLL